MRWTMSLTQTEPIQSGLNQLWSAVVEPKSRGESAQRSGSGFVEAPLWNGPLVSEAEALFEPGQITMVTDAELITGSGPG